MPVNNTYSPAIHVGNAVTTVFAYGFKIFAASELLVKVDGVTQTLNTDYTVSGVGAEGGGSVTFTTAPDDQAVITIERNLPYTRSEDYQRAGSLLSTRRAAKYLLRASRGLPSKLVGTRSKP